MRLDARLRLFHSSLRSCRGTDTLKAAVKKDTLGSVILDDCPIELRDDEVL